MSKADAKFINSPCFDALAAHVPDCGADELV
jgi:hypothetical protein